MDKVIKKQLVKYMSRKFIVTLLIILLSSYALFHGYIKGIHWVAIVTADSVSYDIADTMSKKFEDMLGGIKDEID